jgi:hypothetical protein
MRESFQPRKVGRDAWLEWCVEAIHLSTRHPFRNTLVAIAFCLPYLVLPASALTDSDISLWGLNGNWLYILYLVYNLLCPPLLFSIMIAAGYCSDYSEPFLPRLMSAVYLRGIMKTAVFYSLIILMVLLLGSLIFIALLIADFSYPASPEHSTQTMEVLKPAFLSFRAGEKLWWSLAIYLFFGAATWFIAPLMCLANCPFATGIKLAYQTLIKNPFMFWLPLLVVITMSPLCWLSGIFAIPVVILVSMLIYVSFRDIFMARRRSFPVTSRKQAEQLAGQYFSPIFVGSAPDPNNRGVHGRGAYRQNCSLLSTLTE